MLQIYMEAQTDEKPMFEFVLRRQSCLIDHDLSTLSVTIQVQDTHCKYRLKSVSLSVP